VAPPVDHRLVVLPKIPVRRGQDISEDAVAYVTIADAKGAAPACDYVGVGPRAPVNRACGGGSRDRSPPDCPAYLGRPVDTLLGQHHDLGSRADATVPRLSWDGRHGRTDELSSPRSRNAVAGSWAPTHAGEPFVDRPRLGPTDRGAPSGDASTRSTCAGIPGRSSTRRLRVPSCALLQAHVGS